MTCVRASPGLWPGSRSTTTSCAKWFTVDELGEANEGFGLPIIEAQASGCLVFTSDRAPMTEVGGGAAAYFDPDDAEGAARVITERLEEREQMVQAGFENVRRFDPELMLDNYLAVYGDIVRGSLQALP